MIRSSRFVLPALVIAFAAGTAAWFLTRKSAPAPAAVSGPAPMVPASFAGQSAVLNLSSGHEAHLDLGLLGLGSIRELSLTLKPEGQGKIKEVESSCSCLQTLGAPAGEDSAPLLKARYMAVRPGPVEVNLAFSRTGADGREEILTAKVTGTVGGGDAAWSERLVEMVKAPLPPKPDSDETGVVSAEEARREVEAGRGVLVDIRPAGEFSGSHIIGALNIPASQLKPSGAFRGRDLYLTGSPLLTVSLLEARRGLLRHGAPKVMVVRDGVAGWKAAGGQVFQEMDPPPVAASLTAAELRDAAGVAGLSVLGTAPADEFAFRYYFPQGGTVPPAGLTAAVDARLKADAAARVVIVDGRGDFYGAVNQSAPAHWLGRVSYLRDTFEAYRGGVDQAGLLASRTEGQATGTTKGFAQRIPGQRVGVPAAPGSPGCGTCPKK